ncbi:MAG: CapA family protein [Chloroflexia bacterium]
MPYIQIAAARFLLVAACVAALVGLALRSADSTAAPDGTEVRLLFVGDLMPGRYVRTSMRIHGYDAPFDQVRSFFSSADLALGNLEGPLVSGRIPIPTPFPNQLVLSGEDKVAPALARAGLDILSLANNHSWDAGADGLQSTMNALRSAGIQPLGISTNGAQKPLVREVRGLKIAFLAYTTILNGPLPAGNTGTLPDYVNLRDASSELKISQEVAQAKGAADVVVVFMHWGNEYKTQPDDNQRRLAQAASRAGADIVVGAHPHVVQGMELIAGTNRSTLVTYSLGNALFDQEARAETRQGVALECSVDKSGVKSARLVPMEIGGGRNGYVMLRADNASGQVTLRRAASSTADQLLWKSVWDATQKEPGIALAYRRAAENLATEADLGMGARSRIELRDGTLSVSRQEPSGSWTQVWKSEPGWRVTGYTVGDADADGQPELVYTLWKRRLVWQNVESGGMRVDPNGGALLPHVYIEGWRRGAMRPIWHGSPRPAPVLGVAVAPVGRSGKPLLATLESTDSKQEKASGSVRIWEWTGRFGYELSTTLPGSYSEMWSDGRVLMFK